MTDLARVRKIYKLNALGGGGGGKKIEAVVNSSAGKDADGRKELEVLVLGCIALRGLTN